jgi:hypothetical protein
MNEQLQQFIACGRPWAEQRAQTALELCEAYQRGDLPQSEYQELMADLVRADRLDSEADDMDVKSALVSAIMIASNFA